MRWRRREADKLPASVEPIGYHTEIVVVGNPDVPAIRRERALRMSIGRGLQGYSGHAVGYDRGDPANSLTALVERHPNALPTAAMAALGSPNLKTLATLQPAEYADQVSTNPDLDPYMAASWFRLSRR